MNISVANLYLLKLLDQLPDLKDEFDSSNWTSSKNAILVDEVVIPNFALVKW